VFNPSPLPSVKTQFPKAIIPSLNSSSFSTKYFVLFSSQLFYNPSHSSISHSSTSCAATHFDFKNPFKTPLSQSVRHSNFKSPFSYIAYSNILYGLNNLNAILFDDYCVSFEMVEKPRTGGGGGGGGVELAS